MANEVNNETEETATPETSVTEQATIENSAAQAENNADNNAENTAVNNSSDEPETTNSDEPETTNEVDFGSILEQFEQEQTIYHSSELVTGTVVGISDRGVLVDFGYKSEGIAPIEDFTSPEGEVTVKKGDEIEVVIRSIHSGDAPPMLSRGDAVSRKSWGELETAFNAGTPVIGYVIDKTKGGLRVDLNGVEAFLPGSQVDSRPIRNLDSFKGQEIEAKIIKFSRRRNNVVLSRKALTDEVVNQQKAETLNQIEVGYVVEGTIKNLTEYGAFVDIGGIDGLLHVTDMSWGRLHNPADQFKVNEQIQIKVLKLDREKEKVSLGYKQLLPDPWSTVNEVYPVDSKVTGKVSSVTDYGIFVELEPGVEGLVHVSEISWSKRSKSPKKLFNPNDDIEVQVLGTDTVDRRISLGMKQLQVNPWQTVEQRYPVGTKVRGKVRNLTDFGAFIELEDGIDGLVHVSDITWTKKVKHPKEVLKRDQEVDAVVTNIDKQGQRLSLSIKELTPSAWESFVATHRPGDTVHGKISRFAGFGVFVELEEGLEGLCHISELSDERVDRPESVVQMGQEMDFKILRIEHEDQRIGLSARAVGKEDEPVVDTKMYSTEAKGGMASLGELANLKFGRAAAVEETKEEPKADKETETAAKSDEAATAESEVGAETQSVDDSKTSEPETSEAIDSTTEETTPEVSVAADEKTTAEISETPEINGETAADDTAAESTSATSDEPVSENTETVEAEDTKAETALEPTSEAEGETVNSETAAQNTENGDDVAAENADEKTA
ncbi:MAG: S1 RNA-binding domain-containing protein [Acidobacteriota bacterium]|nr:S1 RNA-binding domain-containing protein [Acidobacteriota bacterium]